MSGLISLETRKFLVTLAVRAILKFLSCTGQEERNRLWLPLEDKYHEIDSIELGKFKDEAEPAEDEPYQISYRFEDSSKWYTSNPNY